MKVRATVDAIAVELARATGDEYVWVSGGTTRETVAGAAALAGPPEELIALALGAMREAGRSSGFFKLRLFSQSDQLRREVARDLAGQALRRKLPWTDAQLAELLDALADTARVGFRRRLSVGEHPVKPVVSTLEKHYKGRAVPPELHRRLITLARLLDTEYAEDARVQRRVIALLGEPDLDAPPLPPSSDPWTAALLAARDGELADALLKLAVTAASSRPPKRFTTAADALVTAHGAEAVGATAATLIAAACGPRGTSETGSVPPQVGDVLRGLAWIGGTAGGEAVARALGDLALAGWVKVPDYGPTCSKAANAALTALGELDGAEAQLGRVRAQLKQPAARTVADAAVARAALRLGIARDAFEERVVPDFGLGPGGTRETAVGDYRVTLELGSSLTPELRFTGASGRPLKSAPAALRRDHPEALATLRQTAKDVKAMAAAQRLRLERLLLGERHWEHEAWRAAYLDHGLVGVLARRLIWTFDGRAALCDRDAGVLLDVEGAPVDPAGTIVSLWHPVGADPGEVRAWRRRLEERELRQPFKQAHREVYLLTDAERTTRSYSNRFAAHVLRQHQMAALARGRGWAYTLQGAWDNPDQQAELRLPEHGLRATFWVERPWNTGDVNEAGVYTHVLTDQVRFHALDDDETLPVDTIPTRVFSEVMRDVDLFVGVTSIGNDPSWVDHEQREGDEQYLGYWTGYAFGELGEAATVRRDLLERLLPKLAIADRARLDGRFLRVRGSLREYKIHLGSGNILMEPNDAYLCIVPGHDRDSRRTVFLPFDGDPVLAIVLSKAFLLARDDAITDPTILSQIR